MSKGLVVRSGYQEADPDLIQKVIDAEPLSDRLFIILNGTKYRVFSLEDASYTYRGAIESANLGASQIPRGYSSPLIVDGNGKLIGWVAYNGKVFSGRPQDWKSSQVLYNPYAEAVRVVAQTKKLAVTKRKSRKETGVSRSLGGVR